MICEILKCASNTSIFAIYHGEPFCGTLWGEANELLHIRDMFFPICISLSNQHIPTAMNMCGYFFGVHHIDPWEIMGETCLFVKHRRRHKKKYEPTTNTIWMILSHFFILSLYTRIHGHSQKCMKTSASCGVELSPLNLNYEVQWSLCTYTSLAHSSAISKKYVRNLPLFCSLCMGKIFFMPQTNFTTRHWLLCYHLDDIISFIF